MAKADKKAIVTAMSVLQACSTQDVSTLTGEIVPGRSGRRTFVYSKGRMAPEEMVIIARSLVLSAMLKCENCSVTKVLKLPASLTHSSTSAPRVRILA